MFYGVDISYAQGNYQPNTETFAIINASRANVGLAVGSMYHTQVDTMRAHGKEVGHYFFNGNIDPVTCANFFVDNLHDFRGGDVLVLDVESESGTGTVAWSPPQVLAFARQVKARTGVTIGIYLNKSLMNGSDWSQVVAFGCWLWIAYYNASPPPIQWWPDWTMWQWTSAGIDKNQAKQSLAGIRTSVAGGGAGPLPDMKKDEEDMAHVYVQAHDPQGSKFAWILVTGGGFAGAQEFTPANNRNDWIQFCNLYNAQASARNEATIDVNAAAPNVTPVNNDQYLWLLAQYASASPVVNVAASQVDLTPVLDAIKAIPVNSASPDLSPVLNAVAAIEAKLGSLTLKAS